jgi:beta-N-acetylhexosaminidase
VETLISEMSLRRKVTQMLMVDFRYWDEDLTDNAPRTGFTVMNDQVRRIVEDYQFGALIYFAQNLVGTEQAYHLTLAMQEAATKNGGIPMLISADQEGGSVYRLGTGTALPGNMALGAAGDMAYAEMAGRIIGSELSALGINTNLAPVVDVNNNANNPVIGLRAYSDDATLVGRLASATIAGMGEFNVIGCAKHFPGHGDTATDSHYGLPIVDKPLEVLKEGELKPYEIAIGQGIEMIMTAHILYPQLESDKIVSKKTGRAESLPATMSDDILTGLLKGEMGFEGIVVTDAMNMAGIADKWGQVQSVVVAISAGVDMICMPCVLYDEKDLANLDAIIEGVMEAVNNGTIPMSRIDDAVRRILTVKENRGILDWKAEDFSLENAVAVVGGKINRDMERQIAAAAVTVVENKNNTLPLRLTEESKVLMLVPYDNEQAQMLMAWNRAKEACLIPAGAEVRAVRFGSADISAVKADIDWADTLIFNSEISGASKMNGRHWMSAFILNAIDYAQKSGKTTIVQSVDKPYDVQSYPKADAVLAVYGCKGSSVDPTEALVGGATGSAAAYGPNIIAGVEVILGTFGAQGKLPVDIPVFDYSSKSYAPEIAYERGHGMTYEAINGHTFAEEWTADDTHHWRIATCGHDLIAHRGEHEPDGKGVCTVCQAQVALPTVPTQTQAPTTSEPAETPEPDSSADTADGFSILWFAALTVSLLGAAALTAKRKNLL